MLKKFLIAPALLIIGLLVSSTVLADVTPARIFADNVVLQRSKPIPVWGWASPGEAVTVRLNGQSAKTRTGKDGKWLVRLKPEKAGGPYTLTIAGKNTVDIKNVLVGEVWFLSGQSNMEMYVRHSYDNRYAEDIRTANNDHIRHFKVQRHISDTLAADIAGGEWKLGNDTAAVADFSSVGYFFARKLYEELKVPIGLVNASWGGTNVETWTSREAMQSSAEFRDVFSKSYAEITGNKENNPNIYPSLLFNAMIHPLVPYSIRGFLWYQGESNAGRAKQYATAFPLMIKDWRKQWRQDTLPFYFVQLASWMANNGTSNTGSTWAELREAQAKTLSLPNTGMAVAIDLGDTKDIHPPNKKDVGLRLAGIALNKTYGIHRQDSGPVFDRMQVDGSKVTLTFKNADGGLVVSDKYGYLKGFEVASDDKKFYYAKAEVQGSNVIVYADSVSRPIAVRYAWADDMPEANLYNKAGLPAAPFRSDDWPGITDNVRYRID